MNADWGSRNKSSGWILRNYPIPSKLSFRGNFTLLNQLTRSL